MTPETVIMVTPISSQRYAANQTVTMAAGMSISQRRMASFYCEQERPS